MAQAQAGPTAYGPTFPNSTNVVSTPIAMSILKIVPAFFFPPCNVVPRKAPWPSLTNGAWGLVARRFEGLKLLGWHWMERVTATRVRPGTAYRRICY